MLSKSVFVVGLLITVVGAIVAVADLIRGDYCSQATNVIVSGVALMILGISSKVFKM